jgi:Zn-dependent protease with chaperone function
MTEKRGMFFSLTTGVGKLFYWIGLSLFCGWACTLLYAYFSLPSSGDPGAGFGILILLPIFLFFTFISICVLFSLKMVLDMVR